MPRNNDQILSLILESLTNVINNMDQSNVSTAMGTSLIETFVCNNVQKYDGTNIKTWISTIQAAFQTSDESHFLKCDLKEYVDFQRFFGLQKFTFLSNTKERVNHYESVQQIWSNLACSDKDSYSTTVRKYNVSINTSNVCDQLRTWMEYVRLADLLITCLSLKIYYKYWTNRGRCCSNEIT